MEREGRHARGPYTKPHTRDSPKATVAPRASSPPGESRHGMPSRSILIVEDEEGLRDVLAMYFEFKSFLVFVASDGASALSAARSERPDVIIMDLLLPHLDGWETIRRLKQAPLTARIPIIACTGALLGRPVERALDAGCDVLLTKPCSAKQLFSEVERVLGCDWRSAGAA